MKYITIPPPPHLKPYVRFFWALEYYLAADEPNYIYRSVADSCAEIIFHYKGAFDILTDNGVEKSWRSGFHFQSAQYNRFITSENFGIFGAYIYPYAVPALFGLPADEGSNQMLDLKTFLGNTAHELEERIMLAADNHQRAVILSNFIERRLQNIRIKDEGAIASVHHVIHSGQNHTVAQLADRYNLSVRQFDRKFKQYAGFSPKLYLRITRLHEALQQYGSSKSLTQIALDCGYYDQSHFIHDVKAFTGYHPGYYF
ncbi:MAG: AraC family transcriptional regulator, partial [Sphingobacteriales bacterium]